MPCRKWISWSVALLPAVFGIFWITLAFLPYGILKTFTGSLMPDGNFSSLKPWNAVTFKILFGLGGILFLSLAFMTGMKRWNLVGNLFHRLWVDAGRFKTGLLPHKRDIGFIAAVLILMALGVVYRLEYVYSPLHHDEAYTYVAFAHSFFSAISDYHLPNNHVFHSLLVNFSTSIFGIAPWAVRLPAFVAGVVLIPAVFWLAKRIYDHWTALGAAMLVAWLPVLIDYSTNARGYTLLALITLLTFILGDYVRKENNTFAWLLVSLLSALGFFTLPVMLLPFGILFVWLFISNLVEGPSPYRSRLDFLLHWSATGFGAAMYYAVVIHTDPGLFWSKKTIRKRFRCLASVA